MFSCSKCPAKFKSFYNAQSHEKTCQPAPPAPVEESVRAYLARIA